MSNMSLRKPNQINPQNINYHQFTLSLINEGRHTGLLTTMKIEQIQTQLMLLLSEAIQKYTHKESNSVKTEVAQRIMESILYCIDMYLMHFPSLEQSIDKLQESDISELNAQGLKLANTQIEQAQQLLQEVENTKLSIPLVAYIETINSLSAFFLNYEIKFDAHNTIASIDYPLLLDDMSWTGIIYIKKYLEHLKLENEFCAFFPLNEINTLLNVYGQKYNLNCSDLLINVSELVLKNAFCSVLVHKKADTLTVSLEDYKLLENRLKSLTEHEFHELLYSSLTIIFKQLNITNPALHLYVQIYTDKFLPQLYNAVRDTSLSEQIVVFTKKAPANNALYYKAGKKLSDEQLRLIIDKIMGCQTVEEKANIIESTIHNVEDLVEVFGAYCIFDNEYSSIFDRMGDYELAILVSYQKI
ncbi:MAG: hypothetical protein H6Q67_1772 [Firmicutes bacterium]|nr:hypothetical protein [Bacillota bacterium]